MSKSNHYLAIEAFGKTPKQNHVTNYKDMSASQVRNKINKTLSCLKNRKICLSDEKKLDEFAILLRRECVMNKHTPTNVGGQDFEKFLKDGLNSAKVPYTLSWKECNKTTPVAETATKKHTYAEVEA